LRSFECNGDFATIDKETDYHCFMVEANHYRAPENRSLTTDERILLEWLIANGSPSAAKYAPQIPRVSVVSRCTCGCPTIDLAVDGKHVDGGSELVADFVGKSPEGIQVGVILHCRGGQISELEVYAIDEAKGAFGLPCPDALVALGDPEP
jgi:hypothetical protein